MGNVETVFSGGGFVKVIGLGDIDTKRGLGSKAS